MATLTLDTYQFIKTLRNSGMAEPQAKAIAEGIRDIDLSHVASKADLNELHLLMKNDLLQTVMETKNDVFKLFVPMMLGQYGLLVAVLMKLAH